MFPFPGTIPWTNKDMEESLAERQKKNKRHLDKYKPHTLAQKYLEEEEEKEEGHGTENPYDSKRERDYSEDYSEESGDYADQLDSISAIDEHDAS